MGYLDQSAAFIYKQPLFQSKMDQLAENDIFLRDNGWPDSTVAVFLQAAAPVGWTQVVTQNDKVLRVVSGSGGGSAGSHAISSAVSLNHTAHSIANSPTHTHGTGSHGHDLDALNRVTVGAILGILDIPSGSTPIDTFGSGVASSISVSLAATSSLKSPSSILTAAGAHDHGGATAGSALTDVTFRYIDVILCSKDTSSGFTDLTTSFSYNTKIDFEPFAATVGLAGNDEFNRLRLTPFGTRAIFTDTQPTGWTLVNNAGDDDRALRVVSGAGGGNGGSQTFNSAVSLQHDHDDLGSDGSHPHTQATHTHNLDSASSNATDNVLKGLFFSEDGSNFILQYDGTAVTASCLQGFTTSAGAGTTSSDGAHIHDVLNGLTGEEIEFAYQDVITATKDTAGAPHAYTDLTAAFAFEKLVSKQRLNNLGKNDEYLKFHTMPAGAQMIFFQASAPLGWTKLTTNNDRLMRNRNAFSGGKTGGVDVISAAITLQHTHSTDEKSHTHTFAAHTHKLDSISALNAGVITTNYVTKVGTFRNEVRDTTSVTTNQPQLKTTTGQPLGSSSSEAHTHTTGTLLSDITLAYIDVIECSKD